jgi:hypothetical protein
LDLVPQQLHLHRQLAYSLQGFVVLLNERIPISFTQTIDEPSQGLLMPPLELEDRNGQFSRQCIQGLTA